MKYGAIYFIIEIEAKKRTKKGVDIMKYVKMAGCWIKSHRRELLKIGMYACYLFLDNEDVKEVETKGRQIDSFLKAA